MMTESELENLVACYIHVEGYTDLRSIYSVMAQEYPGQFERKLALQVIGRTLKEARARHALLDAQDRLATAERVLKVYEKYGK